MAESLGLKNVTAQHSRAEDIKNRQFEIVVSRAVAPLKDLLGWSKHLIKKPANDGSPQGLICLKGGDLAQEIFESGKRPKVTDIYQVFPEEYFREKFIVHVPR